MSSGCACRTTCQSPASTANWPRYQLTTYRQPLDAMIEMAIETLARRTAPGPLEPTMRLIAGELILRRTTARKTS